MTYISWSTDFVKVDMLFVSVPALFAQSLVKEYYKYYTVKSLQTPHTFESLHIRVTDRHCRHLRRKIKFGTKNHKLAKTSGEKNIT